MKPNLKESYFTLVDRMILSPQEDQLLITTNFFKKYLIDVKNGLLSGNSFAGSVEVSGESKQRIHDSARHGGCYALATNDGLTVCRWEDLVKGTANKIKCEAGTSFYSTNWMGPNIIAGGDNGKLIEIDGNTGLKVNEYCAHNGSVNVVRKRDGNTFVSAGYDGVCRVWDKRTKEVEQNFTPSSWQQARRSNLGTHIRCMDVWDDWVVCGGGPNLSLWYLKEDSGIALLDMGESIPSVVKFQQDTIIAGGNNSYIQHWGLSGNLKCKVTTKLEVISDIILSTGAQSMLLAAGAPADVNVFLDAGYLSHTAAFIPGDS